MDTTKRIANITLKAVGAGICIGIGMYTFLAVDKVLGCFLFSIGLLAVFTADFYLYTGLVPYSKGKDIPFLLHVLLGNILGCSFLQFLPVAGAEVAASKLAEPLLQVFVEAIFCNILIYFAVEANKKKNTIAVILFVAAFILCGFEHSVANAALFCISHNFSAAAFLNILIAAAGNAVGGILIRRVHVGIDADRKDRKRLVE